MKNINRRELAYVCYLLMVVSLLFSKFMLSIAMLALIAVALVRKDVHLVWKRFVRNKGLVALTGVFFVALLSGLYSENTVYLLERLRIKLPFLLLPLAFAGLPPPTEKQFQSIFYLLIALLTVCCLWIGGQYLQNMQAFNLDIKESRSMPTPINHIRFSLLIALSIVAGGFIWAGKMVIWRPWERWVLLTALVFLFFFLHVLSVRSGIAAFYLVAGLLLIRFIFVSKRYLMGALLLVALVSLPILAYQFVHTFRTKVQLVIWNYKMYKEGNLKNYSDTQRVFSYMVGWEVACQSPAIGVGMGDVKDEVYQIYRERYEAMTPMAPHNQYLFMLAATGWIGLTLFLAAFLYPLFYRGNYKNGLLLGFYCMVLASFLVENTIENSIGTAFALFFPLLTLIYLDGRQQNEGQEVK